MRFGKKGKLNPRFVGPFEVLERVGAVAYRHALPSSMSGVHDAFYVSTLRKYIRDPSHVLPHQEFEITPEVKYEVQPLRILDRREKVLRNNTISLVKVMWKNHSAEEAT